MAKKVVVIAGLLLAAAILGFFLVNRRSAPVHDIPENVSSDVSSSTVSSTTTTSTFEPIDEPVPNVDRLFEPVETDIVTLFGTDNVMAVTFDGMTIEPGMTVREIVAGTGWYSLKENDILQPNAAGYMVLNNDRWTNKDLQLNKKATARNGEVIVWVHNYSTMPAKMIDCTVYKYKINYRGCKDIFMEQPSFRYLDKYSFGYDGAYPACEYETVRDEFGTYSRRIFGSVNERQVIFDSDSTGLFAITVAYNEYYGPSFDRESGDSDV